MTITLSALLYQADGERFVAVVADDISVAGIEEHTLGHFCAGRGGGPIVAVEAILIVAIVAAQGRQIDADRKSVV